MMVISESTGTGLFSAFREESPSLMQLAKSARRDMEYKAFLESGDLRSIALDMDSIGTNRDIESNYGT